MPPSESTFTVEPASDATRVLERLRESRPTRRAAEEKLSETLLDTHDWRLHRKGLRLLRRGKTLVLEGAEPVSELVTKNPEFAWQLPRGALRKRLESVADVRRLLPHVKVDLRRVRVDVMDEDEKTVARLVLDDAEAHANGKGGPLPTRLRVLELRGYEEAANEVRGFLGQDLGLPEGPPSLYDQALAAVEATPVVRRALALGPDDTAEHATRRVLGAFLDAMEANEAGVIADGDTEFLHDFRVAGRRSRSVLDQIKKVLPEAERAALSTELAWLGKTTGPCRDLDVFLLRLDPERFPEDELLLELGPLRGDLAVRRVKAHRWLARGLRGARYRALRDAFRTLVDTPPSAEPPRRALRPARAVVADRIRAVRKKMLERGRSMGADTPPQSLHRMRIQGKKLRYLLDGFGSLWREKDARLVLRDLKGLQGLLGDFNDAEVQASRLALFARDLVGKKGSSKEGLSRALLAMGRLVERLEDAQREVRKRFATHFERFASDDVERHFRRMFERGGP